MKISCLYHIHCPRTREVKLLVMAKFFSCLTKYHTMMTYPVLNYAPLCEDVWGIGSICASVLKLGTKMEESGQLLFPAALSPGKRPQYPLERRPSRPQGRS
jgi:hypothetical protein